MRPIKKVLCVKLLMTRHRNMRSNLIALHAIIVDVERLNPSLETSPVRPACGNPLPPSDQPRLPRELYVLVLLLVIAHTALNGLRVTMALAAIHAGGGALWVGLLTAMFNIVPAFVAIRIGRLVDRVPLRKMLVVGCVISAGGALLAALEPMLGVLALSACIVGVGWMSIAAAAQYAVGLYGRIDGDEEASGTMRVRAFSVMAMGFSLAAFFGPLIAGFMIDHVSFRAAFGVLAVLPAIAALAFSNRNRLRLPAKVASAPLSTGGARELLAMPAVRNTLISASFITVGWDLYGFVIPVLGSELSLTATQIGSVMSVFAVAVFVVRFFVTRLSARFGESNVMVGAMTVAGVAFLLFAFAHNYALMTGLSFLMGLGLGVSQPLVLSLLHQVSPPGRIGEVNGVRMTMISTSQWTMPLLFGTLSVYTGLLPLFLVIGSGILTGSVYAKRKLPSL